MYAINRLRTPEIRTRNWTRHFRSSTCASQSLASGFHGAGMAPKSLSGGMEIWPFFAYQKGIIIGGHNTQSRVDTWDAFFATASSFVELEHVRLQMSPHHGTLRGV